MYNLLISSGFGILTFCLVSILMYPLAGVVPALLVFGLSMFGLARRMNRILEAELQRLGPMLQARQIKEARAHLEDMKRRYGRWQFLLSGQLDSQLGMIEYLQMRWDPAMERLQRGRFQNWQAQVCIGCIHYRQGRRAEAYAQLDSASGVAPKESMVYVVWAVLLVRDSKRNEALTVLSKGLKRLPDSELLKRLRARVANKRKIDTKKFPETWYQFFPEDLLKTQMAQGRRAGMPQGMEMPRIGTRAAHRR